MLFRSVSLFSVIFPAPAWPRRAPPSESPTASALPPVSVRLSISRSPLLVEKMRVEFWPLVPVIVMFRVPPSMVRVLLTAMAAFEGSRMMVWLARVASKVMVSPALALAMTLRSVPAAVPSPRLVTVAGAMMSSSRSTEGRARHLLDGFTEGGRSVERGVAERCGP